MAGFSQHSGQGRGMKNRSSRRKGHTALSCRHATMTHTPAMKDDIHQALWPEEENMHRYITLRATRRDVLAGALAAGTGLVVTRSAFAQDSTPAAMTGPINSPTRDEFRKELEEAMGYTQAATPGGSFIDSNVSDIQTIHPLLADD